MKNVIYKGVEIIYDYHYFQIMLRANFLCNAEALRIYGCLNRGFKNDFKYFVHSFPVILFATIII